LKFAVTSLQATATDKIFDAAKDGNDDLVKKYITDGADVDGHRDLVKLEEWALIFCTLCSLSYSGLRAYLLSFLLIMRSMHSSNSSSFHFVFFVSISLFF
jgi:hypothetical protein